ncbi:LacI family DNA-binding transcriptional regulator [Salinibacterium sp. SWN1162]|uniref:LacI family DNA-binding transcriptional regulator n=1 Tax=Salinibacterium sp. SWN1162 TaxID=2792053 RepID=UPI0018CF37F0|nr:LacI family DNA-binding transcriptional regulator [Salinibacterium sp. SWN1162]MBH0010263.1 LacI family DNA-binding transcriptional regulator [Salinibacterium sp. SWN1162]
MTTASTSAAPGRATRADVAKLAGVSTAVVSYVTNAGPQSVAPATRKRVLEAAAALGYRPNAAARSLKTGATQLLGMVIPDATNLYFAELAVAVETAAVAHGFDLLVAHSHSSREREAQLMHSFTSRQVDGIIMLSTVADQSATTLGATKTPFVEFGCNIGTPGGLAFTVDHRAGAREGVQHLIEHGHTQIGLVVGPEMAGIAHSREVGWMDALAEAGLRRGPIFRADFSRAGGFEAGRALVESAAAPSAVFVASDVQATGVIRAAHEAGVRMPDELAIVSFDASPESEYTWPALTAMQQPIDEMAGAAVEAIVRLRLSKPAESRMFSTTLVRRASCGCPPTVAQ